MNIDEMKKKLSQTLSEKRFKHSLGVCDEAVRMARLFSADEEKAYIAGLLHDCAKFMTDAGQYEFCEKNKISIDDETRKCPPVMHAPLGAVIAETEYGISDGEILDAIRYHTVAREKMTLLEKIIYVADMTEPGRSFDGVEILRKLSETDIDSAYREAVRQSLMHNLRCGNFIHPDTLQAWNYICEQS